ncbi:polysaccharide deacetylase family protein, partial [Marinilabilia sp.]|uniref:polysaccharide deacetylase family protein n=1 Tax=Marinilabilia sp. TaxID=2021252 RepID=UPI0025B8A9B1
TSADNPGEPLWQQLNTDFEVVCLVYHRFGDSRYPSTNTSVSVFEEHLKYLSDNGFKSFTVSELLNDTSALANDSKKVLITVDDGFASFYENGIPLLEKYEMKATLFVNTESVGWGDYLSWPQLNEVMAKGIEIGSHSHQHNYFVNVHDTLRAKVFEEDLLKAEALFEENVGFVPKTYVYPYGEFSDDMVEVIKKHDYEIAFAQNSGVLSNTSHPYAVPRFPVAGSHVSMEQFISKVNMHPLKVQKENQLPIIVDGGEQLDYSIQLVGEKLSGPLNCFIGGQSSSEAISLDGNQLSFSFKAPANRRRTPVTITTRNSDGQWYWFSRLLINPGVEE